MSSRPMKLCVGEGETTWIPEGDWMDPGRSGESSMDGGAYGENGSSGSSSSSMTFARISPFRGPSSSSRRDISPKFTTACPAALMRLASVALRSEEHTSELQSHVNLVCRLLLEKK